MEEEDFIGKYSVGMINILLMTLNKRVSLAFFRLVSKVDQFNCCNNSVMLSWLFLFHGLFKTKRAARCCTISNLLIR